MVIPVMVPGLPPLSVTLLGMFKSDVRLLAVAAKLAPLIAAAALEQVKDVNRKSRISGFSRLEHTGLAHQVGAVRLLLPPCADAQ